MHVLCQRATPRKYRDLLGANGCDCTRDVQRT